MKGWTGREGLLAVWILKAGISPPELASPEQGQGTGSRNVAHGEGDGHRR